MNNAGERDDRKGTVSALEGWADAVREELGIGEATYDAKTILNLARIVAHTVDRPAAPLTTYLLGIAVGRGQSLADTTVRIRALAGTWRTTAGH